MNIKSIKSAIQLQDQIDKYIKKEKNIKEKIKGLEQQKEKINSKIKLLEENQSQIQSSCWHITVQTYIDSNKIGYQRCLCCGLKGMVGYYPYYTADVSSPLDERLDYDELRNLMLSYIEEEPNISREDLIEKLNDSELVKGIQYKK